MIDDQNPSEDTQPLPIEPVIADDMVPEPFETPVEEQPEAIPAWLIEFASQPDPVIKEQNNRELLSVIETETTDPETLVLETVERQKVQGELESSDSNPFEQKVMEFLDDGEYVAAANFIRLESHNPEHVAVSKRLLRSHLVLREELQPLWDIYEELSEHTGG